MASGGGITQIIWLIVLIYVIIELGIPAGKKILNSFQARVYPATVSTL